MHVSDSYAFAMDSMGTRIKYARLQVGLVQQQVADHFDIQRVSVTQWESNQTKPDIEKIAELASLLNTTAEWLVDGVGGPPKATSKEQRTARRVPSSENVRELDAKAGAGGGGIVELINVSDESGNQISGEVIKDYWRIPESYLRGELRLDGPRALIIEVSGDSGYDPANPHAPGSLFSGDRVIVDTRDRTPSPPGPFLVYDGTGLVVKLCEPVYESDPPRVRLLSRNPSYSPHEIALDDGHSIVGRVKARISSM